MPSLKPWDPSSSLFAWIDFQRLGTLERIRLFLFGVECPILESPGPFFYLNFVWLVHYLSNVVIGLCEKVDFVLILILHAADRASF